MRSKIQRMQMSNLPHHFSSYNTNLELAPTLYLFPPSPLRSERLHNMLLETFRRARER